MNDTLNTSGAYALNALTLEERLAFEHELRFSEELRAETTELQDTALILGKIVTSVAPPTGLKATIMGQIATLPQADPTYSQEVFEAELQPVAALPAPSRWKKWVQLPATVLATAAAAVALIFVGGVSGTVVTAFQNGLQPQSSHVGLAELSMAADKQEISVPLAAGGTTSLIWSDQLETSAAISKNVATLPEGQSYTLWYVPANGNPRYAGTLPATGTTGEPAWKVLDGHKNVGDKVAITVEKTTTTDAPTTDPIASFPLTPQRCGVEK